ncbi:unnamed protein product [Victoria cruziana]
MLGLKGKCKLAMLALVAIFSLLAALYGLLRPVPNGCVMTYMYPTYIPIRTPANVSSDKYGLFLYHEGWKKIDFNEHVMKLSGVPVLFIPGNGGSYKQVRSIAAESDRAYQGGPLEATFYQEALVTPDVGGGDEDITFTPPNQYSHMLDWFAVNLEGEHSAMDGRILEEHTEYVVFAIHRILDQYLEAQNARSKDTGETAGRLPRSVILVGHSMGGFVARAAITHPHLRKSAVETIVTLSSPHQSPPLALQPSLGRFFSQVNSDWRKGYKVQKTASGHWVSDPALSNVIVISISGGIRDYQVRSKLASLDGIVPASNGFTIGTTGMKNVWLSMEHQSILWCNQLVVQVSHALLSIVDSETGQPFMGARKRLAVFTRMLQSGIPPSFNWVKPIPAPLRTDEVNVQADQVPADSGQRYSSCPRSVNWADDSLEKDLYIRSPTVTVLAMDGRRRWLDIKELASNGKDHFVFVTNLAPCSGVRIHLWPAKSRGSLQGNIPSVKRIVEVTSKMVHIPAGPAPRQIEPGSQTEQAPPSAVLQLGPQDLDGFRFITISVAPRPTISGRPPPAASMAVGQFFSPKEGERVFSPSSLILSPYVPEEFLLTENHPLILNLSFSISIGLLPVTLSVKTTGCGIKDSGLPIEQAGDVEHSGLCKLRCFPPVALAWDSISGLHIIPNLYLDTVIVDSSPAMWDSDAGSDETTILLMVDPHCSYKISVSVSPTVSASRFLLQHGSQVFGFCIVVLFFAMMQQARAWELELALPSLLSAIESNIRMPKMFTFLALVPILVFGLLSAIFSQTSPPVASFVTVSVVCYLLANGIIIIIVSACKLIFYAAAVTHVFICQRWQSWERNASFILRLKFTKLFSFISSIKVVCMIQRNPTAVVALVTVPLVSFVHPALGLIVLLLSHASNCHMALCSFLAACFHSHAQKKEKWLNAKVRSGISGRSRSSSAFDQLLPMDDNHSTSPNSAKSYGDTQLEIFHYRQGLLMLHLFATLMFVPSLVAWTQRIGTGQSFPWFIDYALSVGVILHGLCGCKPEHNFPLFPLPGMHGREVGLSFFYFLAGYCSYFSALQLAPYQAHYAMASIGVVSVILRIIHRRREKGNSHFSSRKHSHRH